MSSPSANSKLNYKHHLGPLFKIPIDLPPSPWVGHVPFMFVLFQALKPKSYVELGVHNGCSFLAAASAAALYAPDCRLTGIDTWQGDDHAVYGGGMLFLLNSAKRSMLTFPMSPLCVISLIIMHLRLPLNRLICFILMGSILMKPSSMILKHGFRKWPIMVLLFSMIPRCIIKTLVSINILINYRSSIRISNSNILSGLVLFFWGSPRPILKV